MAVCVHPTGGEKSDKGNVEERIHKKPASHTLRWPTTKMSGRCVGEKLGLNIFEPRYRLMVRRCMEGNRRFGMATLRAGNHLNEAATECEITECQPQPDGCDARTSPHGLVLSMWLPLFLLCFLDQWLDFRLGRTLSMSRLGHCAHLLLGWIARCH